MISKIEVPITNYQEVSTVICDKCSKTLIATPERWHELPVGSYIVRLVAGNTGAIPPEDKEFCSEECLMNYYADRRAAQYAAQMERDNAGTSGPSY